MLGTYLEQFTPETQLEREFADLLHRVLWHPLGRFEARIAPADRFRVAAATHFVGVKQPTGCETLIPEGVWKAWLADPDLKARFPEPLDISVPDNILVWARTQAHQDAEIAEFFSEARRVDKRGREPRPTRDALRALPLEIMDAPAPAADEDIRSARLYFSRPMRHRIREGIERDGVLGVVRVFGRSALRWWHHLRRLTQRQ